MSSGTAPGSDSRFGKIFVRLLAAVAAFIILQLLVHGLVAQGTSSVSILWMALLPQCAAYGILLWFFGRTLLPGREALITRIARSVHRELPPEIEHYTRRVTAFWSALFAAMLLTSVTLFAFASLDVWSLFANILSFPIIVIAFVGEYFWRIARYPGFSHVSLAGTIRAVWRFHRASRMQ